MPNQRCLPNQTIWGVWWHKNLRKKKKKNTKEEFNDPAQQTHLEVLSNMTGRRIVEELYVTKPKSPSQKSWIYSGLNKSEPIRGFEPSEKKLVKSDHFPK